MLQGRRDALLPIYFGLSSNVDLQGRLVEGLEWANETLTAARTTGDPDLLFMGHRIACTTNFWLGAFETAREHARNVLAQYDGEKHRQVADMTNIDPKTAAEIYRSIGSWILGYPDRALRESEAMDAHARRRGHAFDLGYALTFGSQVLELRCEPDILLARVEAAEQLGQAQGLPFISDVLSPMLRGLSWLRSGRLPEGIATLRNGMAKWEASGALLWMPYLRAVLAEGLARIGDFDGAFQSIEESLSQIARPGWEERSHLAEVLRLKGWMLQQQGKQEYAEENYLASLDVARQQNAKSWELRTSIHLARLWHRQGKSNEARGLLAAVYNWFTEGLTTKDLMEARMLLDDLQ